MNVTLLLAFLLTTITLNAQAPPDPGVLTVQALAQLHQGDSTAAHHILAEALDLSPNHPAANDALGDLLFSERHYAQAMERFETVLATNLHDTAARAGELKSVTALALQFRGDGNPKAALLSLQHAREHLPDDPTLLLDLGIQAQQMHLLPEAAEALDRALILSPDDPAILYALARVEIEQGHLPSAEQRLRGYLTARPTDASAHFGLGHLLEMEQRTEDARAEFERSIELQPVQTESYYQLGQIALDAGDMAAAAPLFRKTLARDPHHGGALVGLGIIAYSGKDFAAARNQFNAAVQSSPDYQPAHYYLGLTLARLGEKSASDRELKLALDLAHRQGPHTTSADQKPPDTP